MYVPEENVPKIPRIQNPFGMEMFGGQHGGKPTGGEKGEGGGYTVAESVRE